MRPSARFASTKTPLFAWTADIFFIGIALSNGVPEEMCAPYASHLYQVLLLLSAKNASRNQLG
jgi:hypothetical protein